MEPQIIEEELQAAEDDFTQTQAAFGVVTAQAHKILQKGLDKLKQSRDKEYAALWDVYGEAIAPSKKLRDEALTRRKDARDRFDLQMEPRRRKRKKVEQFVLGLFFLAQVLSVAAYLCIIQIPKNIFPSTWTELLSNPIPFVLSLGVYIVWMNWLRKQSDVEILKGPLFPTSMEASG